MSTISTPMDSTLRNSLQQQVERLFHTNTVGHVGWYRFQQLPSRNEIDATMKAYLKVNAGLVQAGVEVDNISMNECMNRICFLRKRVKKKSGSFDLEAMEHQGNSVTNVYGNNNTITTDQGANGWSPNVPINVAEGSISSNASQVNGQPGGSSTTKPPPTSSNSGTVKQQQSQTQIGSKSKWWEPLAKAATEGGAKVVSKAGDAVAGAIGGKAQTAPTPKPRTMLPNRGSGNVMTMRLLTLSAGNTNIQSQHATEVHSAYPETPCVPLPLPDEPSAPGPSGDRAWLIDTFIWSESDTYGTFLTGNQGWNWPPWTSTLTPAGRPADCYPLPWCIVDKIPGSTWTAMYQTHAYWNCGFVVTITVNGSQFHQGSLVLVAFPDWNRGSDWDAPTNLDSIYVQPYQICNLVSTNRVTLDLPYIGSTPVSNTNMTAPWLIGIMVLSPLVAPTDASSQLSVSLYIQPVQSTFHGLRYPEPLQAQHWKVRNVPGSGAFGNDIAGQEMPLYAVAVDHPPRDYLPARVQDWTEFACRPGLMDTITWTMADDPGLNLATYPVNPSVIAGTSTPLAFVLNLFAQWRGDLQIHLLFTGSAQHYGRLVAAFTPFCRQPPSTMEEAMNGTYTVWDINGQSTLDFTIPFISNTYWRVMDAAESSSIASMLGYVSLWVENSLTGPSSAPPSALVQCFVSACDTFDVRLWQNTAYEFVAQGNDEGAVPQTSEPGLESMEDGTVSNQPVPRDTFDYTTQSQPKDSSLAAYFSVFRQLAIGSNIDPVDVPLTGYAVELDLSAICADPGAGWGALPWVLSVFTYIFADLRVGVRVTSSEVGHMTVSFCPPGGTVTNRSTADAWNYCTVSSPVQEGITDLVFSIPYSSPLSMLATTFCGFGTQARDNFGYLPGNSWGSLIFNPSNSEMSIQIYLAFTNFDARVPKLTWAIQNPSEIADIARPRLVRHRLAGPRSRRRIYEEYKLEYQGWTMFDDQGPGKCYIVRHNNGQYDHWALRAVCDGEQQQISVVRAGIVGKVGYEDPCGEIWKEVDWNAWVLAKEQVGLPFEYSALNNCGSFVGAVTGESLPNTGKSIVMGLSMGAFVAAARCVQMQIAPTGMTPQCITLAKILTDLKLLDKTVTTLDKACTELPSAMKSLETAMSKENVENVLLATQNVKNAAQIIASSTADVKVIASALMTMTVDNTPSLVNTFFSWIIKMIGIIMIIFGSPTPMSLAGALMILGADVITGKPLASLFMWFAKKCGLTPSQERAIAATSAIESTVEPSAPEMTPQGVREFNSSVLAIKNTDWLIGKVVEVIQILINWLKEEADTAETRIHQKHDMIVELYEDSLAALANPGRIKFDCLRDNVNLVKELIKLAIEAKSNMHQTMLTRTLSNYETVLGKEDKIKSKIRPEPLVVVLVGPPGCGKSMMAAVLARAVAKQLCGDPDSVYSPTSVDCAYYDGYCGQAVHLIDDLGQDPEGKDYRDLINLVSTSPFVVPMADLEQKGTHYESKVIIITTNFSSPNERAVRSMAALRRRMHMVYHVRGDNFDVTEAMAILPHSTKYFAHTCPLVELQCCSLRLDKDSLFGGPVNHLDQLVEQIVNEVDKRSGMSSILSTLVPQGDDLTKTPRQSTYNKLESQILSNMPTEALQWLKEYRKPIVYVSSVLLVLSSVVSIFLLARKLMSKDPPPEPQAPYSGMCKPVPKPRLKGTPKIVSLDYQGLPSCTSKIMKNVYPIVARRDGVPLFGMSGAFIVGRWFVFPHHLLKPTDSGIEPDELEIGPWVFKLCDLKIERLQELAYVQLPVREHMSLLRFIVPHSFQTGFLLGHARGSPVIVRAWDIEPRRVETSTLFHEWSWYYKASTFVGLCGALLLVDDPARPTIAGMHFAGIAGKCGASADLMQLAQRLMEEQSKIIPLGETSKAPHIPRRTRLTPSPASGAFETTKEPAVLSNRDPRLAPGLNLDETTMSKHGKGDVKEPWPGLDAAFAKYFSQLPECKTMDILTAINGTPTFEGIDMNQSPGYPWVVEKYTRRSLFEWHGGKWMPKPELVSKVSEVLQDPHKIVYMTFLKDELRPLAKVEAGGTRVVEACPIDGIVAGRMLFGRLFEHMQNRPGEYGSAIGCDPDIHWSLFYKDFAPYPYVYDIDYKGFDASVPSVCFDLLKEYVSQKIDHPAVGPYIDAIKESFHVYGKKVYAMEGGMPSGAVGTSIFNTIINNCVIMSWLMTQPGEHKILAYGDDAIVGSTVKLDMAEYKAFLEKHTNFVVTPADKTSEFRQDTTIYDVKFLKRKFVPDPKFDMFIHPFIDEDTITQSVMWCRDGDWQDTVVNLANLAFHRGPNNYERWCNLVVSKALERGVDVDVPPFRYLQGRWLALLMR